MFTKLILHQIKGVGWNWYSLQPWAYGSTIAKRKYSVGRCHHRRMSTKTLTHLFKFICHWSGIDQCYLLMVLFAMAVSMLNNMPVRKYSRRETSEVSSCLKYMIFSFNVLFWVCFCVLLKVFELKLVCVKLLGLGILTVGVWAWSEKDTFHNLSKIANIALDPAFILICIGKEGF